MVSLGAGTSITPEYYDCTTLYLGGEGNGKFLLGVDGQEVSVKPGEVLYVPPKTLCGTKTDSGMSLYRNHFEKENFTRTTSTRQASPPELKMNLISYEEGSIANLDIAHADNMKFVLMAFDEGTGLTPHRAPGNAILTALEGKAIIGYEGKDYELNAGESFRFDKNGLHSVTAQGKFKMPAAGHRISDFLFHNIRKNSVRTYRTGSFAFARFSSRENERRRLHAVSSQSLSREIWNSGARQASCRPRISRIIAVFSYRGARVSTALQDG